MADSVARLYHGYELKNLKALSDSLTCSLVTEEEKFRSIFRWVCDNVENDFGLYVINKSKRSRLSKDSIKLAEWNTKFNRKVFNKLFTERSTICTGYAYLLKELAYHAGIECKIIDGYGRTAESDLQHQPVPNHSWNAVKLSGVWYLCDATWSSGVINGEEQRFIPNFTSTYFLTDPKYFALNHYPLDTTWVFIDEKFSLNEFVNRPIAYRDAIDAGIYPISPSTFNVEISKEDRFSIICGTNSRLDNQEIALEVWSGNQSKIYTPNINVHNDHFTIEHSFSSRGLFIVHLVLDKKTLFTYRIKVVK